MTELSVTFRAGDGLSLEGKIAGDLSEEAWIICHPHPLYGGSMNNNVVFAARDTFLELGLGTLRFNFRGVGGSEGSFEDGRGEATHSRVYEPHSARGVLQDGRASGDQFGVAQLDARGRSERQQSPQ